MACRPELLLRSMSPADGRAVSELLQKDGNRCPGAPIIAIPAAMSALLQQAGQRRDDGLLGLWSLARDEVREDLEDSQRLWLAELARWSLPRAAIEALLGFERAEILRLIGCEEVVRETAKQQDAGLSDNHLHSGAADELGCILERLVPRVVAVAEPRGLYSTAGMLEGSELNAAALVLALAAACTILGDDQDGEKKGGLNGDAWWGKAVQAARAGETLDASLFKALREPIEDCAHDRSTAPQLDDLYLALGEISRGENLTTTRLRAARRGLVCIALLHGLIAIPPASSLGTFVPRFQLMQSVRDLFGEDRGRLASALTTMYLESGVTAVELRKSIVPGSERTVSVAGIKSSIDAAIEEHAREAIEACEALELNEFVVRMPVTFTRRDMAEVDIAAEVVDFVPYLEPVGETLAVADAVVCATAEDLPNRFVGAVDVVGDEKKVANWVYSIAYQRIAKADQNDLEFACHAGEYFSDQIEGLRRVAEVALFEPARVRRIGHCLSLGLDQGAEGGTRNEAAVMLENAIWTLLVLEGRSEVKLGSPSPGAPPKLTRGLKDMILKLAPRIFGIQTARIADLLHWYLDRFDMGSVSRWVPELEETHPAEGYYWLRGAPRSSLPEATSLRDAMLAASIYDCAFPVTTPSGTKRVRYKPEAPLPAALRTQMRVLLAEAAEYVIDPVREWIKVTNVIIESCPSSNAALTGLRTVDHPVWKFHNQKLRCSINTDDPALFGASLNEEYVRAGMVSQAQGGDGGAFVAALAEVSRTDGMIELPLCGDGLPIDAYRELAQP